MSDFHVEIRLTAGKEHACCECRSVIPKGAKYVRNSGVFDGEAFRHKTCLLCAEDRDWLESQLRLMNSLPEDEGMEFGALQSDLAEYAAEERYQGIESLRRLLGMAIRRTPQDAPPLFQDVPGLAECLERSDQKSWLAVGRAAAKYGIRYATNAGMCGFVRALYSHGRTQRQEQQQ